MNVIVWESWCNGTYTVQKQIQEISFTKPEFQIQEHKKNSSNLDEIEK